MRREVFIVSLSFISLACASIAWDYIVFTQHWPVSTCIDYIYNDHGKYCNFYKNLTSWLVHGIWRFCMAINSANALNYLYAKPTMRNGDHIQNCNSSDLFKESEIEGIKSQLIKYWPNLYGGKSESSLWAHEWDKHGTCATELLALGSELLYFSKGIELAKKYDILNTLYDSNISPDDLSLIEVETLLSSLSAAFGVNVTINCIYSKVDEQHYFSEVSLCMDKSFDLISCKEMDESCPKADIIYPSSMKNNITSMNPLHEKEEL